MKSQTNARTLREIVLVRSLILPLNTSKSSQIFSTDGISLSLPRTGVVGTASALFGELAYGLCCLFCRALNFALQLSYGLFGSFSCGLLRCNSLLCTFPRSLPCSLSSSFANPRHTRPPFYAARQYDFRLAMS